MGCTNGTCHRCWGAKLVVIGALILVNVYLTNIPWAAFIGGLLILGGLAKLVMPHCGHCGPDDKSAKKRKR